MNPTITYRITLKRADNQLNPSWVYQCDHREDGAERPTTKWDRSAAEEVAREHAALAHPGDKVDVVIQSD
jgi:hypothetical protein